MTILSIKKNRFLPKNFINLIISQCKITSDTLGTLEKGLLDTHLDIVGSLEVKFEKALNILIA